MACNQSIETRKKNARDCYFDELGYGYTVSQNSQGDSATLNDRKANKIDELHAKLRCYNSSGEGDASRWKNANFEDICADDNLSELEDTSFDVDDLFGIEQARQVFNCYKTFLVFKKGDATILDIIRLDAVITATIDLLKTYPSEMVLEDANEIRVSDFEPLLEENDILNCLERTEREREGRSKQRPNQNCTGKAVEC